MKNWENPVIAEIRFVETSNGSEEITVPDCNFIDDKGETVFKFQS